ncbi:flagellar export chaperone FliS [Aeoliella mucimassa]|uniref:Flagellar protein FliS n=1 Tax=Aeoliella mucimassa TaxID=2527972 RepID=A0A518ASG8_9BACT|nr:flagellar export chaperone FliS [Aeoliella mucimassa]QDU57627.1 Flagellar protein FliS [Aeoliella mucimassa]
MSQAKANVYLESKVMTASPAQLHLMLIEGAIRYCTKADQQWEKNNEGFANEALVRAIEIVGELLAGVRSGKSEITQKLSELYFYLFSTLTSAYVNGDRGKLADVMRILEFERETWQLACQRVHQSQEQEPPKSTTIVAPHVVASEPNAVESGFSFEA